MRVQKIILWNICQILAFLRKEPCSPNCHDIANQRCCRWKNLFNTSHGHTIVQFCEHKLASFSKSWFRKDSTSVTSAVPEERTTFAWLIMVFYIFPFSIWLKCLSSLLLIDCLFTALGFCLWAYVHIQCRAYICYLALDLSIMRYIFSTMKQLLNDYDYTCQLCL